MTKNGDKLETSQNPLLVLGIETSCDETAVAVVDENRQLLAHKILSQIDSHKDYGGVVPEIAARQHISHLDHLIKSVVDEAGIKFSDLSAIAATTGPGLIGGLMVGVMTAKALATSLGKPYIAVNHLEGHALSPRLTDDVPFPYLLLLVSGGHCQILEVLSPRDYNRLGTTLDDAAGEAFDKTAKLLSLNYPGGPSVEKAARSGNPDRFKLPRPLTGKPNCDFSFSGLKTAVRREAEQIVKENGALTEQDRADLCASFQAALSDCMIDRMNRAAKLFNKKHQAGATIKTTEPLAMVVAGGVAANRYLRQQLQSLAKENNLNFVAPPVELCTDNGAMIAWAGLEHIRLDPGRNDMTISARPRWPLDRKAEGRVGSGKKGIKA